MSRVEVEKSWQTPKDPETARAAVLAFAAENKMKPTQESSDRELTLKGGNQLWMRLLGAWFVRPTLLPRKAEVRIEPADQGATVEAKVYDTMGIGVMDPKLKKKYAAYCEAWIAGLGSEL